MEKLTEAMLAISLELEAKHRENVSDALQAAMDGTVQALRLERYPRRVSDEHRRTLVGVITSMWAATADQTADYMQEMFSNGFKQLTTKQARTEVKQRLINEYIERYGAQQAAQIVRTTEKQVRELVNGGLARGEAVDTVYRNITNRIPAIADQRADVITQTEIHAVNQFASQAMATQSGLRLRKMWDSINDERTRDFGEVGRISQFNHRIMNGTTVPLDHSFAVPTLTGGIEKLLFPGDPKGSAGNIIQCRCSQAYIED